MKKSVLLLFFAGCVAIGILGIGRKIPMNRVNDLGQREGYWRDSLAKESHMNYTIKAVKKMDYLSALFVMNYFCLGNTQRIICPAHGICLEMRENYVVPLIR